MPMGSAKPNRSPIRVVFVSLGATGVRLMRAGSSTLPLGSMEGWLIMSSSRRLSRRRQSSSLIFWRRSMFSRYSCCWGTWLILEQAEVATIWVSAMRSCNIPIQPSSRRFILLRRVRNSSNLDFTTGLLGLWYFSNSRISELCLLMSDMMFWSSSPMVGGIR